MTLQKAILSGGLSNRTVPSRGYRALKDIIPPVVHTVRDGLVMGSTVGFKIKRNVTQTVTVRDQVRARLIVDNTLTDGIRLSTTVSDFTRRVASQRLTLKPGLRFRIRTKLISSVSVRSTIFHTVAAKLSEGLTLKDTVSGLVKKRLTQSVRIATEVHISIGYETIHKIAHRVFKFKNLLIDKKGRSRFRRRAR